MLTASSTRTATRSSSHTSRFRHHEISADGPVAICALGSSGFRLPLSGILVSAPPAQLCAAKRHLIDPIDQLPHIILVRFVPQLVIGSRIRHQTSDKRSRIIRNANTISGEQTQPGNDSCSFTPIQIHGQRSSPPLIQAKTPRKWCGESTHTNLEVTTTTQSNENSHRRRSASSATPSQISSGKSFAGGF
jgi:hypothetical protein